MRWQGWPFALLALGVLCCCAACSTGAPDCGCVIEKSGERRTLACGQDACVAGVIETCGKDAKIVERGACNGAPPTSQNDVGGTTQDMPGTAPSTACDDLLSYCNSSCTAPAATAADCQSTATAGDDDACQQWQLANGVVCHP